MLERLLGLDAGAFAANYWETAPLLTRAADLPSGFGDLFSSRDVDELVASRGLREPFFRLVDDAERVTGVTRSGVAGNRRITDLADPDAVRTTFGRGATLVLQSLQRTSPSVGTLCRELAAELGHPTQCNAYVTPGGAARGLTFHHDTHDVFVLQVEGRKHWQVHAPVLPLPTKDQPRSGAGLLDPGAQPLLDVVLEPGDTLYLPRGYVHAAQTTDAPSLHLTVGILATTWLDLLRDAVGTLGRDDLALRHVVALDHSDDDALGAELLKLAGEWLATVRPEQVGALARERLAAARTPEPLGVMAQAAATAALTADSPLRPRRGLDTHLDGAVVTLRDRRICFPAEAAPMLAAFLGGPTTPARAVTGDPAWGTDDALVVARRLLREGLLAPGDG